MFLRKRSKLLSLMLAVMLIIGVVVPMNTVESDAATHKIVFQGKISIPGHSSGVGKFLIDGKRAFCMEHTELTPPDGASTTSSPYSHPDVAKTLYYGQDGPAEWSGFVDEDDGIVLTSLLLSYYYSGKTENYSSVARFNAFKSFVESQPAPSTTQVTFSKNSANVKWDTKRQIQVTEEVSIKGDSGQTISFSVPNGAMLVKSDGTELTGNVTLKVGETFHFEAPASVSGSWSSGNVGKNFKFQPLLFKASGAWQDLGAGRLVEDPSGQTSLSVKWLDFGSLELQKIDENSELIDGAKFNLKSVSYTGYDEDYDIKDGRLHIENIPVGTYMLTELEPPEGHDGIVKTFQVVINKDETTYKAIVNKLNPKGELTITKTDKDSTEPIQGVEFTLYAADNIYDSITFKKIYEKGDEITKGVTDASGEAKFSDLHMGKYYVLETKTLPGYVPNENKYEFEFRQQDYTTKIYTHEINVENEKTKTTISKVDATTGTELPGATLQVIDPDTDSVIEEWVSTEDPHVIRGLEYGKEYILHEEIAPRIYDVAEDIRFTVGADEKVEMKDEPIKISGQIDKRQTLFGTGDRFSYSIDYRSTSNTWADEYNMIDTIDCAVAGYANVTAIKTPVSFEDYDGFMNVWYKTNKTPGDYTADAEKYNACGRNPENPWNPDNKRITDFTGWKLWKEDVSTLKSEVLNVSDLKLSDGEYITGIAFEHGRVEEGFTTRTGLWDRENLKATDDTVKLISQKHSETFDLSTANGPTNSDREINYEPAIFYMTVVNKQAAVNLKEFWNSAEISIYRNLDEHPDLEDHDDDKVVQKYPIGLIEMNDKDKLLSGIIRTGDNMNIILPLIFLLIALSAAIAVFRKTE